MTVIQREYSIQTKQLWRCHVCSDLHYGERPPVVCPTCGARMAFAQVDWNEALKIIGDRGGSLTSKPDLIKAWTEFGKANPDFKLAEDAEMVDGLADGVLENQKSHGLKYCPCRITKGDFSADVKLICPCNFPAQQTYKEQGECWCGLYVKRDKK